MDATPHIAIRLFTTADRLRHGWPLDSRFIEEFWLSILAARLLAGAFAVFYAHPTEGVRGADQQAEQPVAVDLV